MTAAARKYPRPECPTGDQLVEELRAHSRATGIPINALLRPMLTAGQNPSNWVRQTQESKCPRPRTVERVRAVIDGKTPPPPERRWSVRERTVAPRCGHVVRIEREPAPPPVREPRTLRERIAAHASDREHRYRQAVRLSGTVIHSLQRPITQEERLAEPSDVIRFATEDWPDVVAEVRAYAAESGRSYADAWLSVITAGLQCLREGD